METLDVVFAVSNYSVLPAWLLLVVAPRWRGTERVVLAMPVLLGVAYAILLFGDQPGPQGAHYFTLDGVMRIFTSPQTVIACWVHYLIFDLFVGAWAVRDAQRLGIPHLAVVPSLVLTLMFGPIGLLSWIALRAVLRRRFTLDETTA
ncbi:MAG: ABA4-like family protein [Myxococcota bacterium]|nr:ABA4-like family protein [Myxococcota bacterium]